MSTYSEGVNLVWSIAEVEAQSLDSERIQPAHFFLGLTKLPELNLKEIVGAGDARLLPALEAEADCLRSAFEEAQVDTTTTRRRLRERLGSQAHVDRAVRLSRNPAARRAFDAAESIAAEHAMTQVQAIHLLSAILESGELHWLEQTGGRELFDHARLLNAVQERLAASKSRRDEAARKSASQQKEKRRTPFLDRFGRNLTQLAADGKLSPLIGRRDEVKAVARALVRRDKSAVILVGDAGVGKTQIVEGLAQLLAGNHSPDPLKGKRIVEVFMSSIVAGTTYRGEFEERLISVIDEASDPDIILFIDEIHTVMGAGGSGSADAANILKPTLARGALRLIGATTWSEYRRDIEPDEAFMRRCELVRIEEPSRDETDQILRGLKPSFEQHYDLRIHDDAVSAAIELAARYVHDRKFPDKAIDLIEQACAAARIPTLSISRMPKPSDSRGPITRQQIVNIVEERYGVRVDGGSDDDAQDLLQMEEILSKRVLGQPQAVDAVCNAIRTARAGLNDPRRPVGVFLLLGSTGTGKTELAKALAEFLFGDEEQLLSFDMSEYSEGFQVSRLIGSPPGYVGYEEDGQLTGPMRTNPYSVVLFDEIEKAHSQVHDLLLQILDEGRLTDARGRQASFRESVVILTSNLGSDIGKEVVQRGDFGFRAAEPKDEQEEYERRIEEAVRAELKPELINRVQEMVFFYPLAAETMRLIIDKILDRVRRRWKRKAIELTLADETYDYLLKKGYCPEYGAREMERTIQDLVVKPLANALLEGKFHDGDRVLIGVSDGEIRIVRV